ncbi:prothoracicotropic hormone-like [Schistocerca gregaria]|uniref:prothoracicotropic hormone-like n=1 Tax=Schistocerca gregaria TaxID=7010 RepID=UPI00211E3841|nr:prothoracicotropic hormone-like [Schistocerca gregaria]
MAIFWTFLVLVSCAMASATSLEDRLRPLWTEAEAEAAAAALAGAAGPVGACTDPEDCAFHRSGRGRGGHPRVLEVAMPCHCRQEHSFQKLGVGHYPQLLRQVGCRRDAACCLEPYRCRQLNHSVLVLVDSHIVPDELDEYSAEKLPKELRDSHWNFKAVSVGVGCQCVMDVLAS